MEPLVSVLIPVYNCAPYLKTALQSMLSQTYGKLEIICVDDCSADNSFQIMTEMAEKDERIICCRNKTNLGISKTLNHAFELAQGELIARMDGDDIALPERISTQVAWMDKYPKLQILGSWAELFGAKTGVYHYRRDSNFIKAMFLFRSNGFPHYAVLMRRRILEKYKYESRFDSVEDTELWLRILMREPDIHYANVPKVLAQYRQHEVQTSQRKQNLQSKIYSQLISNFLNYILNRQVSAEELVLHQKLSGVLPVVNVEELVCVGDWYRKLSHAYNLVFPDEYFVIDERWWRLCYQTTKFPDAPEVYGQYSNALAKFTFLQY